MSANMRERSCAVLLLSYLLASCVSTPAIGTLEREFHQRFMHFCTRDAQEEVDLTEASALTACQCLYAYANDRTTPEVKRGIVDLPSSATVSDFDAVYVQSAMDRNIVNAITREYVRCVDTYGVRGQ